MLAQAEDGRSVGGLVAPEPLEDAGAGGANTLEGQFTQDEWHQALMDPANNVKIANPMFRSTVESDWDLRPLPGSPMGTPAGDLPAADGFLVGDHTAN